MTDRLCQCGTTNDAAKTAMKIFKEAAENNCLIWAAQLSIALGVLGQMTIEEVVKKNEIDISKDEAIRKVAFAMLAALGTELERFNDVETNKCH